MLKKIFNTYNKAKFFFVKPKTNGYITSCYNAPIFPLLYGEPTIRLFKKYQYFMNGKFHFYVDFLIKLNKLHLGGLKPVYKLPQGLMFGIDYHDVFYKTKGTPSDFRFELSPFYKITLFGISITIILTAPNEKDSDYWESILTYNYYVDKKPFGLKNIIFEMGHYITKDACELVVDKAFIHPEYHHLYDEIEKQYWNEVSKK